MCYEFDSRNKFYKNPTGAVKENTNIHFKIVLDRNIYCRHARLKIRFDESLEEKTYDMFWCGMFDEDKEMWECDAIIKNKGIYWYYFELSTDLKIRYILKQENSSKSSLDSGGHWQITVYDKNFTTPDWLKGGIMYQIFPDRFYNSGTKKENVPKDRIICNNWYKVPEHKPNNNGTFLNNEYFGGDILGIIEKIPYLKSLGVTCIYLNPIFEAHSNHRYNTANYLKIDPLLGTEEDFIKLCKELKNSGIRLILDGVFSHTGSDSIYFNKYNRYKTFGAYNSQNSIYYSWFKFINWPHEYMSWWGIKTLPEVNENDRSFNAFINSKEGVANYWIKRGISGWRLDVADELTDSFIENFRKNIKQEKYDALVLGEVWEDASNKVSYGKRRKFILGNQFDSVMNYPFRNAIIDFIKGTNAKICMENILSIIENYPPEVMKTLMNPLGTHDTERIITILAGEKNNNNKDWQSRTCLSEKQKEMGIKLLKMASTIQYTLPGVPCIYYGDEVGLEGYGDPFNRRTFPWGRENEDLLNFYINLSKIRKKYIDATQGDFTNYISDGNMMSYILKGKTHKILCSFNSSKTNIMHLPIKCIEKIVPILFKHNLNISEEKIITLNPCSFEIFEIY